MKRAGIKVTTKDREGGGKEGVERRGGRGEKRKR